MAKKMYDVRPPKSGPLIKIKGVSSGMIKKSKIKTKRSFDLLGKILPVLRGILKRGIFIVLIVGVVGFVTYLHLNARATFSIVPGRSLVQTAGDATAQSSLMQPDTDNHLLRAKGISMEKEVSGKFSATGLSENASKSEGTITVINNYHLDQTLVEKTRFLSADGELFYTTSGVSVPAGDSVDVGVEAAEPGPDYNIDSTTFSIPGLLGSVRYTYVYGESSETMTGGGVGETAKVTESDLDSALEESIKKAELELLQDLEEAIGEPFKIIGGSLKLEILDESPSAEVGDEVEEFGYFLKVRGDALAYHEDDARAVGKSYVLKELTEDQKFIEDTLSVVVKAKSFDSKAGEALVDVRVSGEALQIIDAETVKESVAGRTLNEVEVYFSSSPTVENAEVEIIPFWVKAIPEDLSRVEVRVEE